MGFCGANQPSPYPYPPNYYIYMDLDLYAQSRNRKILEFKILFLDLTRDVCQKFPELSA